MGRLVPEDFPLSTLANDAERRVVEALRDGLTDGWLILPDVGLRSHRDHQLDVVVVHQDWGIIDLEIKGHRMQLRDGLWCCDGSPLEPQPMAQAKENAYALRGRLRAQGGDLSHVSVEYGVVLPNTIALDGALPPDVDQAQVITATDLEDPQDALEGLSSARWHQALTSDAVEMVVRTLRPDAVLSWDPEALARAARNRLDELCAVQVASLETLDANRRVFVTGGAGTGKTRLAARWAQRARADGQRVLLTCYNDPLADELNDRLMADEQLMVGGFLRVAFELEGMPPLPVPADADHAWWNTQAVAHLLQHWHEVTQRFDTIVVDEGQDFNPAWLALLEQLLDPEGPRRLMIVADNAQDLYGRGFQRLASDDGWCVAELVNNCRNVHPIASILRRHLGGARSPRIGPEGLGVEWYEASDLASVIQAVSDRLVYLLEIDERDQSSIVVATFASVVRDALLADLDLVRWEERGTGRIACENVHRIKGLEADCVILASPTSDVADPLLYVGISRAISQLLVVSPRTLATRIGLAERRKP
jgi:hypothetical protein